MGKALTHHFTKIQKLFLDQVKQDPYLVKTFYLTGGTALAACYINHRLSEDIDLFSDTAFDEATVTASMAHLVTSLGVRSKLSKNLGCLRYDLTFPNNELLKVDFVYYDFSHIEATNTLGTLAVDSIRDIAVNKLLAISQRTASKDFVDLYFLLKKYTVWDLQHGVKNKFKLEIEPLYLSSLFAKAEELTDLPIMNKQLSLKTLKTFFLAEAKKLASKFVKP